MSLFKKEKENNGLALNKTKQGFFSRIFSLKNKYITINEDYFEELEQMLITSDVSVEIVLKYIDTLKDIAKKEKISDVNTLNERFSSIIKDDYKNANDSTLNIHNDRLSTIMVVGVNGVGKTTSIAKLANLFKKDGKKVLLAAADTFRAGAIDQLKKWADTLNIDIVSGKENSDPSSIIYEACKKAKNENYNILICDTAGRIQTKQNLMAELTKMANTITKVTGYPADEVLLVIDSTTGQNGLIQASSFFDASNVSGIILTKMDSTSKGGIILSINTQLNLNVKYYCFGEGIDDIDTFDLDNYINSIMKGL